MSAPDSGWNAFARANAAQRWRKQSAAMGRHMTETIVAAARVAPGMRALDVACGTGEPAISIATLLAGTGEVVGIDISTEPLKLATERARERGLTNVRFEQGDVHALPFPDASFDRLTCRLGVMFFSDLEGAAREMRRVLRTGGRATFVAWGALERNPYFTTTGGTVLRMFGQEAPPEAAQMFRFGAPGSLPAILRAGGFRATEEEFRRIEWTWPGAPEEVWEYFKAATVPFRGVLDAVPPERRAEVDRAVLAEIARYSDGNEVRFGAEIALVSATA